MCACMPITNPRNVHELACRLILFIICMFIAQCSVLITLNKLFCWPGVLFSSDGGEKIWSKTGYNDLKNLPRSIDMHGKSQEHISCTCKLQLFGKHNIATVRFSATNGNKKFNNSVKQNREILKTLVDN